MIKSILVVSDNGRVTELVMSMDFARKYEFKLRGLEFIKNIGREQRSI